jgi:hypothetical protein
MSKLSNADFRAIYETNRSTASSSTNSKRKGDESERDNKPKKFKPARRFVIFPDKNFFALSQIGLAD